MSDVNVLPEIKEILGAMLFGAKQPISIGDMRKVLKRVAENEKGAARDFATLKERDLKAVLESFAKELESTKLGIQLVEVNRGFRLVNRPGCGPWLRELLERGKPQRLSKPALETLAIIAYRQPCTRSEIEGVRGVEVDQMVRNLLELQLIRITGRSELAGRPFLLGTTTRFMEHFGLKSLDDLPGVDELRRMEAEQTKGKEQLEMATAGEADEEAVDDEKEEVFIDEDEDDAFEAEED